MSEIRPTTACAVPDVHLAGSRRNPNASFDTSSWASSARIVREAGPETEKPIQPSVMFVKRDPARRQLRAEPADVPVLQVVGAGEPEAVVVESRDGEIAHQPSGLVQHRREPDRAHGAGSGPPAGGRATPRPRGRAPRTARTARSRRRRPPSARPSTSSPTSGSAFERSSVSFSSKSGLGAKYSGTSSPQFTVNRAPAARELVVARRRLQWAPRGELLVRVGHHEPPRVELGGRGAQVAVVRGVGAEPRDVHAEHVVARVAVDDPVRDGEADARALREARHASARRPVVRDARRPVRRAGCRRA